MNVNLYEKKVIGLINKIKRNEVTPKESGIGKWFNRLRDADEALFESLIGKYKQVLNERQK